MSPFQLYRERSKLSATIAPVAFQTLKINNAGAIEHLNGSLNSKAEVQILVLNLAP